MAASATHSAVSRYRPAIIAVTGFAAAYGAYLVYSNLTDLNAGQSPTKPRNLRRSNAIHRSSRRRRHSVVITVARSRDAADSQVHCQHGQRTFSIILPSVWTTLTFSDTYTHQLWGAPEPNEVAAALRLDDPRTVADVIHDIETTAIDHLFTGLLQSGISRYPDTTAADLGPLVVALRRQDETTIRELAHLLTHRYWSYNNEAVQEVINRWCVQPSVEAVDAVQIEDLEGGQMAVDEVETLANESEEHEPREPGQGIKGLLYHIAEEESRREAYVHRGTRCDACGTFPIRGIRWHCLNCPDFDLCSTCEAGGNHTNIHVFAKIKIPIPTLSQPHHIQELWYPGDIRQHAIKPEAHLIKRLARETGLEEDHIDAYFEQFSCMVSLPLPNDPLQVGAGIDRFTFEKALTSRTTAFPTEPNYLYERMFCFYDADQDGLIGFEEWVTGLAYLLHSQKRQLLQRAPDGKSSLQRVFNGYDSDGDGYVSRSDFLRLFRSKYAVHKAMILDTVAVEEAEPRAMGRDSTNIIRSSQPISSVFTEADVPQGEIRRPRNKPIDEFGDFQTVDHSFFGQTVLPDQQSEMDNTFWTALFDRYGKPNYLADLHPQFDQSAEARLRVRSRYTDSESLPIDSTRDRYLVRTDTRGLRPYSTEGEGRLRDEWSADIANSQPSLAESQNDGSTDSRGLEQILNRGQSYQVSAHERSFGNEVLYQVSEEAFNELLDPIFKEKERMASQVRATQKERKKFHQQIERFVKDREAFRRELQQGSETDPLLATANSTYMNGNASHGNFHQLEKQGRRERQSVFEEAIDRVTPRNSGTPLPIPPTAPASEQQLAEVEVTRPQHPEQEVSVHLGQEAMVPTDEASLDSMETEIREQPLEELLRAAGYQVDEPDVSISGEDSQHAAGNERGDEPEPTDDILSSEPAESATFDPTLPQFRPNIATESVNLVEDETMHLSPSRPATPTPREPSSPVPAYSGPDAIANDHVVEDEEVLKNATASAEAGAAADSPNPPQEPSASRLEFLAMLDVVEKHIIERGGPGRLSVDELEQILSEDEADNTLSGGRLKGVVESWLEWAIF